MTRARKEVAVLEERKSALDRHQNTRIGNEVENDLQVGDPFILSVDVALQKRE